MENQVQPLSAFNQWLWGSGALGFTLLERMLIVYVIFFYLPPGEYQIVNLVSDQVFLGFLTVVGITQLLARIVDGLADPAIATLSDKSKAKVGRRKIFLLISALPMAATSVLIFYPPGLHEVSFLNGIWLGGMWCLFYIFFTAFITPYFALISELGHTNALRINLGTTHALFALFGTVIPTVVFPLIITSLQGAGAEIRLSYQLTAGLFALVALLFMYISTLSFSEKKHCFPAKLPDLSMWKSLRTVLSSKPFRIFLMGELFLQFALYMLNLGLMYYVAVIFVKGESFLAVLGGITIGVALLSFPFINKFSKKVGKRKIILLGILIMVIASFVIFLLSWNMTGIFLYVGLVMFGLGGISLAVGAILIVPTYADLAREESSRTGEQREAMFYAARNLPLKFTVALSGAAFAYLISAFGRDIAEPLGVQLTILVVTVFSLISFFFFAAYPEEQIQKSLSD